LREHEPSSVLICAARARSWRHWEKCSEHRRTGDARVRFTFLDGSQAYSTLHGVQKIYYKDNSVLTVRIDRADGYWEDFAIRAFELLEVGHVCS
jgi:hypothetical protein